ncbi:MAG: thiamine-phosphate kinase [Candidatus Omnitrophica bacterium]|nr:thiamine-phosphate kinase [Candidatus Omnitrophota bacterium]
MKRRLKDLRDIGEFGLITRLQKRFPTGRFVTKGIGDDTAVWPAEGDYYWLFTTDQIIEGIDFDLKKASPEEIGWKAVGANVSDIAAMGGWPFMTTITLAMPATTPINFVDRLYRGIKRAARLFHFEVVGGDLSRLDRISISVAMVGKVEKPSLTLRSGAEEGDKIFVSGVLGGSILGKHLSFEPRLKLSRFLAKHSKVHAMIDVSDGLVQDLGHILKASGVGARIYLDQIPVSRAAYKLAKKDKEIAFRYALTDGEDYELLWTVSLNEAESLKRRKTPCPVKEIGVITKGRGLVMKLSENDRRAVRISKLGYRHF